MKRKVGVAGVAVALVLSAVGAFGMASVSGADGYMLFGRPDQGNECDFPCTDNASFHAKDRIVPGAISVTEGTLVNFDMEGFHQVAIYEPGVKPQDIEPNPAAFPFVNDTDGLLFAGVPTLDAAFTFDDPGKYLVICNVAPHFEESQMWGWVIVR